MKDSLRVPEWSLYVRASTFWSPELAHKNEGAAKADDPRNRLGDSRNTKKKKKRKEGTFSDRHAEGCLFPNQFLCCPGAVFLGCRLSGRPIMTKATGPQMLELIFPDDIVCLPGCCCFFFVFIWPACLGNRYCAIREHILRDVFAPLLTLGRHLREKRSAYLISLRIDGSSRRIDLFLSNVL